MKILLDTNVLISGLLFPGGLPDKIVRSVLLSRLHNVTSPDLLTELRRVLLKKFCLSEKKVEDLIRLIAGASEIIYPTERLSIVVRDETDNRVLECAFSSKAEAIVTGDEKHLLSLKSFRSIPILSPSRFVERFPSMVL